MSLRFWIYSAMSLLAAGAVLLAALWVRAQ